MDQTKKLTIVNRISSGIIYHTINGQVYKLIPSNKDQRALADMIYRNMLSDNKFSELITREQAKFVLNKKGLWTPEHDTNMKKLEKHLEELKVQLYKAAYSQKDQKSIRRQLTSIKKSIEKGFITKYSLDHMTLEYYADMARSEFLLAICIRRLDDTQVYTYENFWLADGSIMSAFTQLLSSYFINSEEYREIARTEPFRALWAISKEKVFDVNAFDLTSDQRNIILYSRMYDNVYEHPERPSDEIIEDDDMLDGWFTFQQRKSEKERKDQEVQNLLGKKGVDRHSDTGGEMFIMADSSVDAKKIRGLNDMQSQQTIKQRDAAIRESGQVKEQDLPDVKMELRNQAMKKATERSRGNK